VKPDYVRSLEDYWIWLDRIVDESGGWLEEPALIVRPLEPWPDAEPNDWAGLACEQQRLSFADGSSLSISMVLDTSLALTDYSFHYQDDRGRLIWRKCNRTGHEEEAGRVHIHRPLRDGERVEPHEEVDLEEALDQVHGYQRGLS
jgi:Family of unknown function (DUF6516)